MMSYRLGLLALAGLVVLQAMPHLLAAERPEPFKGWGPPITVIALYNGPGIPDGWEDSTTRPEATGICNGLIANQSKFYVNAISKSRCIIQVQR